MLAPVPLIVGDGPGKALVPLVVINLGSGISSCEINLEAISRHVFFSALSFDLFVNEIFHGKFKDEQNASDIRRRRH